MTVDDDNTIPNDLPVPQFIHLLERQPANTKLPVVLVIAPVNLSQLPAGRESNAAFNGVTYSKYKLFEGSDTAF
ncbi:hypothetical protein BDV18DRAFT_146555 [Aspergillus unguis]